ncbi:MAG: prolyl oligopeptidase family serine peptidase, partial [Bacteroidetes bacterium]|nr:prolyl oligopeptidase family serine peptidase [Bacteroidota bacterium]
MKFIKFNTSKFQLTRLVILFLIAAALIQSCKEDETPKPVRDVLVSYEKVGNITYDKIQVGFSILLNSYPEVKDIPYLNTYNVDIYKVKYKTTFKGETINASGMAYVPKSNAAFPVISFQNGTNTVNANAPSMNYTDSQFALLQYLSGLGYIVVAPDYIGFGESANILHPYYHRESNDAAVIDLIRATEEIINEKAVSCTSNGKLMLIGYSQGGWATLSAL